MEFYWSPRSRASRVKLSIVLLRFPIIGFVLAIAWSVYASEDVSVEGEASPASGSAARQPLPELRLARLGALDTVLLAVSLPPVTREQRSAMAEPADVGPVRIGFHRDLPVEYQGDLTLRLRWVRDPEDGSVSAAVTVTSPGAERVRLAIRARLPPGGEMRFFRGSPPEVVAVVDRMPFRPRGPGDSGIGWSPSVAGATIGLEITLPSGAARDQTTIEIDRLAHHFRPVHRVPSPQTEKSIDGTTSDQLECRHVDIQCRDVGSRRHAVAKIQYEDNGSFVCSGTLLNDKDIPGFIPYFLTANHCVSTQSVADSVEAWWFYQLAACGGTTLDQVVRTSGLADLLATRVAQDSTLLRLIHPRLPGGLVYAGWSSRYLPRSRAVYGIHHPCGDRKKFVAGFTRSASDVRICDPNNPVICFWVRDAIPVDVTDGAIEGSSSGSGLWHGEHLVGVLSGQESCQDAKYGRFSDFFPYVEGWLSPDRVGIGEVAVQPHYLQVPENGEASYTLRLSLRPTASVTVAARPTGDDDVSVSPTSVMFRPDAWRSALRITVSAAEDADMANGSATIGHTVTSDDAAYDGVRVPAVRVTEQDNDRRAGTVAGVSIRATREPGELVVTWNPVPGADSYVVEWRQQHEGFVSARQRFVPGTVTSTTLTDLDGDALYVVRVAARQDGLLDGSPSGPVSAVTSAYPRPFLRGWRLALPIMRDGARPDPPAG